MDKTNHPALECANCDGLGTIYDEDRDENRECESCPNGCGYMVCVNECGPAVTLMTSTLGREYFCEACARADVGHIEDFGEYFDRELANAAKVHGFISAAVGL